MQVPIFKLVALYNHTQYSLIDIWKFMHHCNLSKWFTLGTAQCFHKLSLPMSRWKVYVMYTINICSVNRAQVPIIYNCIYIYNIGVNDSLVLRCIVVHNDGWFIFQKVSSFTRKCLEKQNVLLCCTCSWFVWLYAQDQLPCHPKDTPIEPLLLVKGILCHIWHDSEACK